MLIVADQLVAHAVGDYVLQSDWMAGEKTKKSVAALAHVLTYGLPFLFLTQSPLALLVIVGTHFVIDRWRLARYVCWVKNFLAPRQTVVITYLGPNSTQSVFTDWWHPWSDCVGTGYHKDRPAFLAVWLMIITDNVMHVLINALALRYL